MTYWIVGITAYAMIGAYFANWAVRNQYVRRLSFLEWLMVIFSWPFMLPRIVQERKKRRKLRTPESYFEEWTADE
jgi:hypothetical protein